RSHCYLIAGRFSAKTLERSLPAELRNFDIEDRAHSIANHDLATILVELDAVRTLLDDQCRQVISGSRIFGNSDRDSDRMHRSGHNHGFGRAVDQPRARRVW